VETWRAWWEPRAAELAAKGKLRWGEPWTALAPVRELLAPHAAQMREDLSLEMAITGPDLGFEPTDWVARQRSVLAEAEQTRGSGVSAWPAGTFPEAWLGRGSAGSVGAQPG
jgi:hypothetical protein